MSKWAQAVIVVVTLLLFGTVFLVVGRPAGHSAGLTAAGSFQITSLAILGGFLGGLGISTLQLGVRAELREVKRRLRKLEESRKRQIPPMNVDPSEGAHNSRFRTQGTAGDNFAPRKPHAQAPGIETPRMMGTIASIVEEEQVPDAHSGRPIQDIIIGYGKLAAGPISRSAFSAFFNSIGHSGPVDVEPGGQSIRPEGDPDGFLISVYVNNSVLVFPSYSFIANLDTQFATIASVPENVASIFTLTRGSGEVSIECPAIFIEDDAGLRLKRKGEIRGFAG
jgi:hypothetical protein